MPGHPPSLPAEPTLDASVSEVAAWVLQSEAQDWEDLLNAASGVMQNPDRWEGTLWKDDYRLSASIGGDPTLLVNLGLQQARFRLMAIADQFETVQDVVEQYPYRVVTVASLGRAIMESGLPIAHLCDSEVSSNTRLCRAMLYAVDEDSSGIVRELRGMMEPTLIAEIEGQANGLQTEAATLGFTLRRDKAGRVNCVSYGDGEATFESSKVTPMSERYIENGRRIYGLLSGASHGRMWFLRTYHGDDAGYEANLGGLVASIVRVSHSLTRHVCVYFGLDPSEHVDRKDARRELLIETARRASPPRDQPEE